MSMFKKAIVVGRLDRSLIKFLDDLIRDTIAEGHTVIAAAPPQHPDVPGTISALWARSCAVELNRTS